MPAILSSLQHFLQNYTACPKITCDCLINFCNASWCRLLKTWAPNASGNFRGGKRKTSYSVAFSGETTSTELRFSHNRNQTHVYKITVQFSLTQMQYHYPGKIQIQNPWAKCRDNRSSEQLRHESQLNFTTYGNGNGQEDTAAKRLRMRSLRPFPVSSLCCSFSFGVLSNCPGTEFAGMALKSSKRRSIHPRVFPFSKKKLKTGHFTLLFCRGRQRNVPECVTHVQSHCLAH